jgi:drug/metabolite transporter (DMT)-like permease
MRGREPGEDTLTPRAALALVAVGASVISVTALFVKWISLGPSAIGAYRCGFAALALGAWVAATRRSDPVVADPGTGPIGQVGPSPRALVYAVAAGACYAGDLYVWHKSILLAGTGLATLLANTQVFWVALLSALLLGERLSWRLAVCAALALLGVVLLAIPGLSSGPMHLEGIALGLATGVFYAGYYLCLRASQREPRRLSLAANLGVTCVVSAALLFVTAAATDEVIPWPEPQDLWLLLLLGVGAHVGGWVAISRGITAVPAATGSLLLLLQPVLATIWGIAVFGEPFGVYEVSGTLLSLLAIYAAMLTRTPAR